LNAVYWLGWIFALAGAHLLFFGNSMYDPSLDALRKDMSFVRAKYQYVKATAQSYMNIVSTSYVTVDTSSCRTANASQVFPVLRNLIEINVGSQALYEASYPIPMRIDQMDSVLSSYAMVAKDTAVYTCYSFVTVVCLLSLVAVGTRNKALTIAAAWLQGITSAAVMLVRTEEWGVFGTPEGCCRLPVVDISSVGAGRDDLPCVVRYVTCDVCCVLCDVCCVLCAV
jgi:hypothetical protein